MLGKLLLFISRLYTLWAVLRAGDPEVGRHGFYHTSSEWQVWKGCSPSSGKRQPKHKLWDHQETQTSKPKSTGGPHRPSANYSKDRAPLVLEHAIFTLGEDQGIWGDAPFSVWNESSDNSNMLLTEVTATEKMSDYWKAEQRSTKQGG